jgi:hypothetical protein
VPAEDIDHEFLRRRLFRSFQTTNGNAGMGIGLYEARDQILRMGGRIDVHSRVGDGYAVHPPVAASWSGGCLTGPSVGRKGPKAVIRRRGQ